MELIINNKVIDESIYNILKQVKLEISTGKLNSIIDKGNDVLITCPFHSNGRERHPSCRVLATKDSEYTYGFYHCFTCGAKGSLSDLVNACFEESSDFGDEWLQERFGNIFVNKSTFLPEINLNKNRLKKLDESVLDRYNYYHPYLTKRQISKEVIDRFKIGYDRKLQAVVFPVWDEYNNLTLITKRSVLTKQFYIDENAEKPVYLYNFIKKDGIKKVYVTESQINALTLWSWGYPAIALIGTGHKESYKILRKSGIRHYILCLDGDEAGDKGILRFIKNMPNDLFIDIKIIPRNKDVNDLSKDVFDSLKVMDKSEWLKKFNQE